ncbi:hypothetical protein [Terricaulis sp.]|uniref:hypothetical protein n=1 Tax=Terricaulis sp. TaxID=2768686 RepID=UPI002AC533D3|nr:hypothetical protein [Terricaulis sp.]MDZ4690281.1 hypothetical protein [Terricaulis sp.]
MSEPFRIIILQEGTGFAAACLEDLDFLLFCPTLEGVKASLASALEGHFGRPVAYWIVSEPSDWAPRQH